MIEDSVQLRETIDSVGHCDDLLSFDLSVTIANPVQEACPIIACSKGFTELTGYQMSEIVGRNCRLLLNGVPEDYIDSEIRLRCRDYVSNTTGPFLEPSDENMSVFIERRHWVSSLANGEILCVQTNATKSGDLFKNMLYLKHVELNEKPFILGLQSRLPEEWETSADIVQLDRCVRRAVTRLSKNVAVVELFLGKHFWYSAGQVLDGAGPTGLIGPRLLFSKRFWHSTASTCNYGVTLACSESNYIDIDVDPTSSSTSLSEGPTPGSLSTSAPPELHTGFDMATMQDFPHGRFEPEGKLEDASRNFGIVFLMRDLAQGTLVATKQMPNSWIKESHEAFNLAHPGETEQPWNDIGCNAFLDSVGYPYCAKLIGVFRDKELTSVVTEFAAGGDIFRWASKLVEEPGLLREARVKPLAKQIGHAIQYLHDLSIVHGDISFENIVIALATGSDAEAQVKIIDFGAASAGRFQKGRMTGKPEYLAPEMFDEENQYDGFLSDAFSFGVVIYAICLKSYPWRATGPNGDALYRYVESNGFAAYARKKKTSSQTTVEGTLSPELLELLGGLLNVEPASRLTLGESVYGSSRKSSWKLAWTHNDILGVALSGTTG